MSLLVKMGLIASLSFILIASDYVYFGLFVTIGVYVVLSFEKGSFGTYSTPLLVSVRAKGHAPIERFACYYLFHSWWILVLVWIYGFFLALFLDVPIENAQRNFFGLLAYILVPVLFHARLSTKCVVDVLLIASFIQITFLAIKSVDFFFSGVSIVGLQSFSELRFAYTLGALTLLPLLSVSIASFYFKRHGILLSMHGWRLTILSSMLTVPILLFFIIVPSMSKGLFLICLMLFLCSFIPAVLSRLRHGRVPFHLLYFFLFSFLVLLGIPSQFWDLLFATFNSEDIANATRSEQAQYLIDEFSIFGGGLGSALRSGYVREDTGYGFELNYLNIVHKLGVFSIPLFMSYVATLFIISIRIWSQRDLLRSFISLGAIGFLIVGAGNPVLLSPVSVIMHSIAIYLLVSGNSPRRPACLA